MLDRSTSTDANLLAMLSQDYQDVRALEDGTIVATLELLYTRSLVVDLDWNGWGHRYCYENRERATQACAAMVTGDDAPLEGFVAERLGRR
jgi:hypothetical protein